LRVPVVVRFNETIDLNRVEYSGAVTRAELDALSGYAAANPVHMRRDTLAVILPSAHFDVSHDYLDALFERYRELYAVLHFEMLRRAAWICHSSLADAKIRYWLGGDTRSAMFTAVRLFETYAGAGEWLVLNSEETLTAERGEGFVELFSFTETPTLAR
jgi:hypothetical protein